MGGPGGALATLLLVVQTASAQPGTNRSSYACNHTAGVCVQQAGGPFSTLDQCLNDEACRAPSPPTPSPDVLPAACDLQFAPDGSTQGCSCDGYDLSLAKGQVVRTGVDSDGYTFLFSVCAEIPREALPRGCKDFADKPAALRYRHNDPSDCTQIGSLGPCDAGESGPCGMFGSYDAGSSSGTETLNLSYRYPFGCNNSLDVLITSGVQSMPSSAPTGGASGAATCDYTVTWPGLPLQPRPVSPSGFAVPKIKLLSDGDPDGVFMPMIALGTGSGQKGAVGNATKLWLASAGGSAIDTAYDYQDQLEIQQGISDAIVERFGAVPPTTGGTRDPIFLTTKIPCTDYNTATDHLQRNLDQLGVDRVDIVLMHFPCKGATATENTAAVWKAMEGEHTCLFNPISFLEAFELYAMLLRILHVGRRIHGR
jgi:hypothetical protein